MENDNKGNYNQENRDFQNEKIPFNQDSSDFNNFEGSEESTNDYGTENTEDVTESASYSDRRTEDEDLLEEEREYNSENLDEESNDDFINESDSNDEMEDRSVKNSKLDPHFGGNFGF